MNRSNTQTKPTADRGGRKYKNDIIFIAAILAVVAIAAVALAFGSASLQSDK
jgi:hypothetical protein